MQTSPKKKVNGPALLLVMMFSASVFFLSWQGCVQSSAKQYSELTLPDRAASLTLTGNDNLYKVSDSLYRSAKPTAEGFRELEILGIKSVINLRTHKSDDKLLEGTDLKYYHIPMKPSKPLTEDVVKFLKIVNNPENLPALVHCRQGSDRTGTMVAAYRIVIQDWNKQDALDEMTKGPFGFHHFWYKLPKFIKKLDTDAIKKQLNEN